MEKHLLAEAKAFDSRISERVKIGFIPDLRKIVKCDYFYKSFWRDPLFVDLYLGEINKNYLEMLDKHSFKGCRILDVGCGAGYMSLELARNGYDVHAIDISQKCIEEARKVLEQNEYTEGFGKLKYEVCSLEDVVGEFDVILFSVSLHHMLDLNKTIKKCKSILKKNGGLMCYEPCHDLWHKSDASIVALIRSILSITGHWYDPKEFYETNFNVDKFNSLIDDIHFEFVEEQDKNETGQSPNDNESSGKDMIEALEKNFDKIEFFKGHSFIYRLLGGIRGTDQEIKELALLISNFDKLSVKKNYMNSNGFYFYGKNR